MSAWADWPEEPPFGQGFGITHGENPSIWVVEFYLTPFDLFVYSGAEESAVSALSAGKVIGFRCLVNDADAAFYSRRISRDSFCPRWVWTHTSGTKAARIRLLMGF